MYASHDTSYQHTLATYPAITLYPLSPLIISFNSFSNTLHIRTPSNTPYQYPPTPSRHALSGFLCGQYDEIPRQIHGKWLAGGGHRVGGHFDGSRGTDTDSTHHPCLRYHPDPNPNPDTTNNPCATTINPHHYLNIRLSLTLILIRSSNSVHCTLNVPSPNPHRTKTLAGNEGHGIRTNILRRCTHLVKIPGGVADPTIADSSGGGADASFSVDSLNVSVTGGILLHHILKNKRQSKSA